MAGSSPVCAWIAVRSKVSARRKQFSPDDCRFFRPRLGPIPNLLPRDPEWKICHALKDSKTVLVRTVFVWFASYLRDMLPVILQSAIFKDILPRMAEIQSSRSYL